MRWQFRIVFEYADTWSGWKWRKQECTIYAQSLAEAERKCIELYGLGVDCVFKIIAIEIVG